MYLRGGDETVPILGAAWSGEVTARHPSGGCQKSDMDHSIERTEAMPTV